MKGCAALFQRGWSVSLLAAAFFHPPASAAELSTTRTTWVDNTITNQIEVRVPRNLFVNQYRTNVFDVFRTNHITRAVTNKVIVEALLTNFVNSYRTNWKNLYLTNEVAVNRVQTNLVDVYHTNWQHLTVTNQLAVSAIRTNFVAAFRTNWQALALTNWQTVLVMKTNWVTQFVTNLVQMDLKKRVTVNQADPAKETAVPGRNSASAAPASDDPIIEVSRTSRPPANNLVEVELRIRWPVDTADAPPVQQWRIEREGGNFLSFGQEQELKKELPIGNYKVEAKLQRDEESPAFILRGTLAVTIKEAIVQQRPDRSKLASVVEKTGP